MKNLFLFAIFIASTCQAFAQSANPIAIPLSNPGKKGRLEVEASSGSIKVIGTIRKDVSIKYSSGKNKQLRLVEAKNGLKKVSGGSPGFEISQSQNNVSIETQHNNKGVNFEIEVPNTFDLELDCYNGGDITVKNINGEIDIENYNGSIYAHDITGSMVANSYNGKVKVSFKALDGKNPLSFSSFNQDIDITLPANAKLSPRIKSERGEIFTGFDIQFEPVATKKEENNDGSTIYIGSWINGKINGGGPELRVETYNGNVYIRKNE